MSVSSSIQFLFLDFGGCIDAPGIHSRKLFNEAFQASAPMNALQLGKFQDAYSLADRQMMSTGEAKELHLKEFNRWNSRLIAAHVGVPLSDAEKAADHVTTRMQEYINDSARSIRELRAEVGLGIISNFTGNLSLILAEHGLLQEFDSITESYYAGVSKPSKEIFQLALQKHSHAPASCMYVGDNPRNDIHPAKSLGMMATLIHEKSQKEVCGADFYIEDLRELLGIIQSK